MASRITVRHNTIAYTPRAAINICDGTWGGHLIEWNDCFETVLETHDHGAFNSWGRDRFWHQATPSGPRHKDKRGKPLIRAQTTLPSDGFLRRAPNRKLGRPAWT